MNVDLYNFHTRASSTVTGQSAPRSTSLPHTSASSNIPPLAFLRPHSVLSILEWWCLSLVSGSISVSSCLPTMRWSTPPYQLPLSSLQGVSALPVPHSIRGKTPSALTTRLPCRWPPPSCVNSVSSSLIVPCSAFAFIGVDSQQKIGLPRISCSFNDSCLSASAPSLHQPLLPPYKVSPIRVEKLRREVLTHPDQSFVTCVLDGLQNGFWVGFNLASVSLKSATQNMPSVSLQPSVIDDYLHPELAKGRVAGPFSSPPLPHLQMALDSGSL